MDRKTEFTARQEAIRKLLSKEAISDQQQLVERLKAVHAISTNQAAVSRDLQKLGVVKRSHIYELPQTDIKAEIFKLAILKVEHNETTIVITTFPGLAAFVGDCLDHTEGLDILGCLAGENVVFVTPRSIKTIASTARSIQDLKI
jgi:transcriptional regulator of arginine metabolism